MNLNWAIYLGWDITPMFQRVVPYTQKNSETVTVTFQDKTYDVPIKSIRIIDAPEYVYGEIVSPVNHPKLLGAIADIVFYFKTNEPSYWIIINGKKKSKRYFKNDLIRRS